MTIVDLAKARAYAEFLDSEDDETAAEWIVELADEVESLQRALEKARGSEQIALADADRLFEERDQAIAALCKIYATIGTMIKELM